MSADGTLTIAIVDAIRENHLEILLELLYKLYPDSAKTLPELCRRYQSEKYGTIAHLACTVGSKSFVQEIMKYGIDLNSVDMHGNTPLHKASQAGRHDVVDVLMKSDAIHDFVKNNEGKTAFDVAKTRETLTTLERKWFWINETDNRKTFIAMKTREIFQAANAFDLSRVKELFNDERVSVLIRKDVSEPGSGDTLLHVFCASKSDQTEAVKWLIEQGANPHVANKKRKFPIDVAKHENIKQILKEAPKMSNSFEFPEGKQTRMEGYLNKWTNYAGGYKRRYFVLEDGTFSYYKSQEDYPVACRGSIHLSVAKIVIDRSDKLHFDVFGNNSNRLHLRADSAGDAKKWIVALTEIQKYLTSMDPQTISRKASMTYSFNEDEDVDIPVDAGESTLFNAASLQIQILEECLNNFVNFTNRSKDENFDEKLKEFEDQSKKAINSIKKTIQLMDQRESKLKKRITMDIEKDKILQESLQALALENSQFEKLRKEKSESSLKIENENLEDEDLFFDADEEISVEVKEDFIKDSIVGYPDQFRNSFPETEKKSSSVSLWSILKNAIGKDLTRMAIPVNFNEPLSMLQRLCEDVEYVNLLTNANFKENSLERLSLVAAFAMSSYSSTEGRTGKPFNPLLGETFEFVSKEKGYRYLSEQVSHHPPISACYCDSDNFVFWSEVNVYTRFTGKSFEAHPLGVSHVTLKKTGEHFSWKKVITAVNGILMGKLTIDHYGTMTIINHSTGENCVLEFCKPGWRSKDSKIVQGKCYDANGNDLQWNIHGKWNDRLILTRNENQATTLWKRNPTPEFGNSFNFTSFALQLNELTDSLKDYLCPTDSRLREDQRALERGDYDAASKLKNDLEEKQRLARKERTTEYQPRW
ncbi:hypothetical protein ROZALSC1DRAFT_27992, partial [Rozella allomycis CSF55]